MLESSYYLMQMLYEAIIFSKSVSTQSYLYFILIWCSSSVKSLMLKNIVKVLCSLFEKRKAAIVFIRFLLPYNHLVWCQHYFGLYFNFLFIHVCILHFLNFNFITKLTIP